MEYHIKNSLTEIDWDNLQPGDHVYIYWKEGGYHEKVQISVSGTPENPIKIIGVLNALKEPVIDGDGAIEIPSTRFPNQQYRSNGVIIIMPHGDEDPNYQTSWISISGLEIRNANEDNFYFTPEGEQIWYSRAAAGIALYMSANIAIYDNHIHDNGNGIFFKSFGTERGTIRNLHIHHNYIHNNGALGSDRQHNFYGEGSSIVVEFNYFGQIKEGTHGNNFKDRSAGLIFRYNYVHGGARLLDLVDPDDGGPALSQDPAYQVTLVYGNVFYNDGSAGSLIRFGGDTGVTDNYRRFLCFYHNTVVNETDREFNYREFLFNFDTPDQVCIFYNNIVWNKIPEWGSQTSEFFISANYGEFYLGVNLFAEVYGIDRSGMSYYEGEENIIYEYDPGLNYDDEFTLLPYSSAIGVATDTTQFGFPPAEYSIKGTVRSNTNDLGAFGYEDSRVA